MPGERSLYGLLGDAAFQICLFPGAVAHCTPHGLAVIGSTLGTVVEFTSRNEVLCLFAIHADCLNMACALVQVFWTLPLWIGEEMSSPALETALPASGTVENPPAWVSLLTVALLSTASPWALQTTR